MLFNRNYHEEKMQRTRRILFYTDGNLSRNTPTCFADFREICHVL